MSLYEKYQGHSESAYREKIEICVFRPRTYATTVDVPKADIKQVELLRWYGRAKSAVGNYSCGVQFDRGRRGGNVRKIEFPCRQSRLRRRGANTARAPARAAATSTQRDPRHYPKLQLKTSNFESRQSEKKFSKSAQVFNFFFNPVSAKCTWWAN